MSISQQTFRVMNEKPSPYIASIPAACVQALYEWQYNTPVHVGSVVQRHPTISGHVRLIATDGHNALVLSVPGTCGRSPFGFHVPRELSELCRRLPDREMIRCGYPYHVPLPNWLQPSTVELVGFSDEKHLNAYVVPELRPEEDDEIALAATSVWFSPVGEDHHLFRWAEKWDPSTSAIQEPARQRRLPAHIFSLLDAATNALCPIEDRQAVPMVHLREGERFQYWLFGDADEPQSWAVSMFTAEGSAEREES